MSSTMIETSMKNPPSQLGRRLRGPEKSAILFLCLGEKRGSELMQKLDDSDIQKITRAVTGLGVIPAPLVEEVMTEFSETVLNGAGVIGSLSIAENMLRSFLPSEQVDSILKDIRGPMQEKDLWSRLGSMNETIIADYLNGEHEQTAAAILSKLHTDVAAQALTRMTPERRQAVIERMITMKTVPAETMRHIEETLQRDLVAIAAQPGVDDLQKRMADLFNKFDPDMFDEVSAKLEERMPQDFGPIRQKMFTFDDLMKLDPQSLTPVMRGLEGNTLPLALRGATKELRDHFLAALPARSRDMLLDEMDTMGPVRGRDVRAAQAAIVDCARGLAAQDIIRLPGPDDEEEMIE
ncbi:MAG: flagellar motor switch protein FliG [Loktanella sp.]|nr:flagellar motor switch protein FliG [Loktanella sp.]